MTCSLPAGRRFDAFVIVLLAAVTAGHMFNVVNKRREQKSYAIALAGVTLSIILIVGGIMAIGRPIFGSGGI